MAIEQYFQTYLPIIETELQAAVDRSNGIGLAELRDMLAYHMGWVGPCAGPEARGKRIRPMLVLLTTAAAGGEWKIALPAACAAELIHNFSLIHDDIEDKGVLRRGRPTVWKKWGIAQATNAGDAMFALAHLELLRLSDTLPASTVIKASKSLNQTCLHLTQGQYLDLAYEQRLEVTEAEYWPMIEGKTSALLAACTEIGALIASDQVRVCQAYKQFGYSLGLAFQAQDDLLGIWGDAGLTGKSNESDLVTGKKTLPVLFGLNKRGKFYQRWLEGSISTEEAPAIADLLAEEGAQEYTRQQVDRLTDQAIQALDTAYPQGDAGHALIELANFLLQRRS
jgi:geranylgeranyl diphosphate synthase type I